MFTEINWNQRLDDTDRLSGSELYYLMFCWMNGVVTRSHSIFVISPLFIMTTATSTKVISTRTDDAGDNVKVPSKASNRKAGNKPVFSMKNESCSIAVYANERKRDNAIQYKFTLSRSAFSQGEFKTLYSFRPQDVEPLMYLIGQAVDFISEQSQIVASPNEVEDGEE